MNRHFRKTQGFSLIELMIVTFLVAILMGLGLPSLRATADRNAISADAKHMHHHLTNARNEAITKQLFVAVANKNGRDKKDWSDGWIVYLDDDGIIGSDFGVGDTLIKDVDINTESVTVLSQSDPEGLIIFHPQGHLVNENEVEIAFCDSRLSDRIDGSLVTVATTGRVSVSTIDAGAKAGSCNL